LSSILTRLDQEKARLKADFARKDIAGIRCCWLDDLLHPEVVATALGGMPPVSSMMRIISRKERKYIWTDLDEMASPIREIILAFAQQEVADTVAEVVGKKRLEVDPQLYNGGVTTMVAGDFMYPHLDNSHDYTRTRRRDIVLLYYMSGDRKDEDGGTLQLWDPDIRSPVGQIPFRGNRLVIIENTDRSWHSVTPIAGSMPRISLTTNLYSPLSEPSPVRLTHFVPPPGRAVDKVTFAAEYHLRSLVARVLGRRMRWNAHVYRPRGGAG
jgi:hypothetical protein